MNEYPSHVKHCLLAAISQITARKDEFVKQPGKDFSRNRNPLGKYKLLPYTQYSTPLCEIPAHKIQIRENFPQLT